MKTLYFGDMTLPRATWGTAGGERGNAARIIVTAPTESDLPRDQAMALLEQGKPVAIDEWVEGQERPGCVFPAVRFESVEEDDGRLILVFAELEAVNAERWKRHDERKAVGALGAGLSAVGGAAMEIR